DVYAQNNQRPALWVVNENGDEVKRSFAELSERSNQVANFLRNLGIQRRERLLIMLGNIAPLWEVTLAAMKLGVVISPATILLTPADLQDRVERGGVRHVITDLTSVEKVTALHGLATRIVVGGAARREASSEPVAF